MLKINGPILSKNINEFYNRKDSLSVVNNCLMFSDRTVIPKKLQHLILKQFHSAHPGMNRMKALARSYVFLPGMNSETENLVRRCNRCNAVAKSSNKKFYSSWKDPEKPWSRVHVDFSGPFDNKNFSGCMVKMA